MIGALLPADRKENIPLKHFQSKNEIFKTSGSDHLPDMSTIRTNASGLLVTSDDKTCCSFLIRDDQWTGVQSGDRLTLCVKNSLGPGFY